MTEPAETLPAETLPAATVAAQDPFGAARAEFEAEIAFLESEDAANLDHAALEDRLIESNRRVYLLLCQGYFDQRAAREQRVTVIDAEGVDRPYCEPGHRRRLMVIFGDATVDRFAYRRRGDPNLYPADAALNLPAERYSHGLRRLAAIEATRGSSTRQSPLSAGRPGRRSGNARPKSSSAGPRPTWTASTPRSNGRRPALGRCWSCPRMGKGL